VLRVGTLGRLGTLDPRNTHDTTSSLIFDEIYETPFAPLIATETPAPLLFSEPLRADGGTAAMPVYSAPVRSDVLFSDGTPLTAELMVRSLAQSPDFLRHATATASGNRVVFKLTRPNPRFDVVLTNNFASIVLERAGAFLGTGPFMFERALRLAELPRLDRLTLIRNPKYRNAVDADQIVFATYPAGANGGTELLLEGAKKGEYDFTYSLTSVDAAALRGYPFVPSISTGNATGILYFNTSRAPLDDVNVRKAIAHAVDRRAIAESTYDRNPLAYVAAGLLPPLMGRDANGLQFDLGKARSFAAAAGTKMPKRLSLTLIWSPRPYMPNPKRAGELLRDQLAVIGIELELITPRDRPDYFDRSTRGNYDLLLSGWIADTADPADFVDALLMSHSVPSPTNSTAMSNNLSRHASPAMDAAIERYRSEPTAANRAEMMNLIWQEAPLLPIIYGQAVAICSRNISGFQHSVLGRCSLSNLRVRPPLGVVPRTP
jgi:ABC-type transport system substrate-binding protein